MQIWCPANDLMETQNILAYGGCAVNPEILQP